MRITFCKTLFLAQDSKELFTFGTKLSHLEVGDPLGSGGMGKVFSAKLSGHGQVCFKRSQRNLGQGISERRLADADLAAEAKLQHELGNNGHIAQIYGAGMSLAAGYVIVMKLYRSDLTAVQLAHLKAYDDACQTSPPTAYSLSPGLDAPTFLQIAAHTVLGVQFLHMNKLVHNDIKPANILVVPANTQGEYVAGLGITEVVVGDFGLTTKQGGQCPGGTPHFSPPENIYLDENGDEKYRGKVHTHTDMYALGVTLRSLASGEVRWLVCANARALSLSSRALIHLILSPLLCSQQLVHKFASATEGVSEWVSNDALLDESWLEIKDEAVGFINSMTATDPAARPTAAETLKAIEAWKKLCTE